MISGEIEVNWFADIRLILETIFGGDLLLKHWEKEFINEFIKS